MTIASAIPGLEMLGRFNCGVSNFQTIHNFFSKCNKSQVQYIKNTFQSNPVWGMIKKQGTPLLLFSSDNIDGTQ